MRSPALKWISLGGWCGPGQMLAKLGCERWHEPLPFDAARCSMDGLVHFAMHSKRLVTDPAGVGFFPSPTGGRYPYDPVSIWLLFRSQHTAITHFDINRPSIQQMYRLRFEGWDRLVTTESGGVAGGGVPAMLRTSLAVNPIDEIRMAPRLMSVMDCRGREPQKQPRPPHRDMKLVLVLHQQPTQVAVEVLGHSAHLGLHPDDARISVWSLPHGKGNSLFDRCHDGYREIIERTSDPHFWEAAETRGEAGRLRTSGVLWSTYKEISHVEGVPALRGSCVGFGTTLTVPPVAGNDFPCPYCGSRDGHAVVDVGRFDTNRGAWSDEELSMASDFVVGQLVEAHGELSEVDIVAAVEGAATRTGRSANECLPVVEKVLADLTGHQ